jgi:CheY-like chemotaxis protein
MAGTQKRRFLILNNNERESDALVQMFKSLGHEAASTWSGRDALDYLRSARFDLLLVDQYVADMYVGEFIKRVLQLPNHPRIAITKGSRKLKPIKLHKLLGEFQFFDKEQPDLTLLATFPEFYDGPLN